MPTRVVSGFSKLSRSEKLTWLQKQTQLSRETLRKLDEHLHSDPKLQGIYEEISENTISNFYYPLGLAPNFLINDTLITVPMVTDESSVVAAASHAAKFWALHGGFHTTVTGTRKIGQVHFTWSGNEQDLQTVFSQNKKELLQSVTPIIQRMEKRGGGVEEMEIRPLNPNLPDQYQLFVTFQTADAMGANFINSVLEALAVQLSAMMENREFPGTLDIIMSILSNYTPECGVTCYVEGETSIFEEVDRSLSGKEFAQKFVKAVQIAVHDPYRAVTHNKGIFNGMDAVLMATGNDFRAVEACGHAFASRSTQYSSLTCAELSENSFRFTLEVPMAVGSVGGLTGIHPLALASLEILGFPSAEYLMQVVAAVGLASNFNALRSLITLGIQHGHMKMHLSNILTQLKASPEEAESALNHFKYLTITYADVAAFLESNRTQ